LETTTQVIVPYLFALEKHKSAHENRYSSIAAESSKTTFLVARCGTETAAIPARVSRRAASQRGNACLAF
jgi:hypothetical protein